MSYITQEGMIERFGEQELIQLTDHEQLGVMGDAVLLRAIEDADTEINSWIATKMSVPATAGLPFLARVAADIARYRLYDDAVSETVRMRYEDAVRALTAISKGLMTLGETAPSVITGGGVKMQSSPKSFGREYG